MRHCEAWRLHARGEIKLVFDGTSNTTDDLASYDDSLIYDWCSSFSVDDLAQCIDDSNNNVWRDTKIAICCKLNVDFREYGYGGYSTRRVRRQIWGSTLSMVQKKQITIPIVIPFDLEHQLLQHPALASSLNSPLIPIHDSEEYQRRGYVPIASLRNTVAESGNLRYWVISKESMVGILSACMCNESSLRSLPSGQGKIAYLTNLQR